MAMSFTGTFRYVATVPRNYAEEGLFRWPTTLGENVIGLFDFPNSTRLAGLSPTLEVADALPMSNPSVARPAVLRSRFTLIASGQKNATVSSASFYVDRNLKRAFRPGDQLHMVRTLTAGIGLSLLRNNKLVFAVGTVSCVPLGREIEAQVAHALALEAAQVFLKRDPEFTFQELPVEIRNSERSCILCRGRRRLGDYEIWIDHGYLPGLPGVGECASISLNSACTANVASVSAQILDLGEVEITEW